ncbi:MAG: hypothetical protein IJZ57_02195 [Clostridia bacterium]|nr:hypothetical protein [Clostridia bacterium]
MDKMIYDIFHLGSVASINKLQYELDEAMILGSTKKLYSVLKFLDKNGSAVVYGLDIETNNLFALSPGQLELYKTTMYNHEARLVKGNSDKVLNYKTESLSYVCKDFEKIFEQENVKSFSSKMFILNIDCNFEWFSFLYNKQGGTLVVAISETEMVEHLAKTPLYNDINFTIFLSDDHLNYNGNIVKVEKTDNIYILYIHPYSMEIMQSTQCNKTTFNNIRNPFSVMDFIVNHSDSDVKGFVYPDSDEKYIHNYIVAGVIKNININIEDCVIGNVRIGKTFEVSQEFEQSIEELAIDNTTVIWVNMKADSLYNAFCEGKKILVAATEFLSFMVKNDMYADWFGSVTLNNNFWDVRSHYPKIGLSNLFYIENCIIGESITLTDENMLVPTSIELDENSEYLFDYDWVEKFFINLQIKNKKVLRLQYAMKWIVQAWHSSDEYDKVIYCSMALEFIVNGEKGKNIFDEYAFKAGREKLTKTERKQVIKGVTEKIIVEDIKSFSEDNMKALNESVVKMINNKLTEPSFCSKLDTLISRLSIPVSADEIEFLHNTRRIRNELIHGLNMASISTLESKKLCGITSRILMYKLIDELGKDV